MALIKLKVFAVSKKIFLDFLIVSQVFAFRKQQQLRRANINGPSTTRKEQKEDKEKGHQ